MAEATSATPKPYSAFLSASGIAESNTLPVSHGVSVPAMPTTTAMPSTQRMSGSRLRRAELDHFADFEQRLGKRPVHRVRESRQRRRGLGRQTLRRHAPRPRHDVRARPLRQQRHRILGRRHLADHRPVIVPPPVLAQRHDADAVARRGRGDVHPFFEGQLVVARRRLAHLDAEHAAHQLARLEHRFCRRRGPEFNRRRRFRAQHRSDRVVAGLGRGVEAELSFFEPQELVDGRQPALDELGFAQRLVERVQPVPRRLVAQRSRRHDRGDVQRAELVAERLNPAGRSDRKEHPPAREHRCRRDRRRSRCR